MDNCVIDVQGVVKTFDKVTALGGVSFRVRAGEMFSVVGPDGAGKTTLLRTLCGILKPTEGKVLVLGHDTHTEMKKIKPSIGYLSQKFSLYGDLSIDENIEFFAEIHGVSRFSEERDRLLEFTRLAPYRKRLADKLSGGMKQKLALACTLIHAPQLLFLDEPTTGVDPVSRRDFWLILSGLLKKGLTIVLSTPYMDEAERCDRVGFLNEGKLLIDATPAEMKALIRDDIIEIVCEHTRDMAARLKEQFAFRDIQMFGDRLNVMTHSGDESRNLLEYLAASAPSSAVWRTVPPRLENVFISLIKKETESHHES